MSVSVGIDIGALKTMIVADDGEIVLTETGSTSRPSLVAFSGNRRLIGEEALPEISGENTVYMLNSLLGKAAETDDAIDSHRRLKRARTGEVNSVTVNFNDTQEEFAVTSVTGMFLAKQIERIRAVYAGFDVTLSFALPTFYDASVARAVAEACQIASFNLENVRFADAADCLLASYAKKLLALRGPERTAIEGKKTLVVEMGAAHSTIVVASIDTVEGGPVCLSTVTDPALGAVHFDFKLFSHFAAICLKKDGTVIEPGTKRGLRLLSGCERIRKLLSQLGEGKVTVENLTDAGDVNFTLRRDDMQTICEELLVRFRALIHTALEKASLTADQIYAIEIVGGGVRMPSVQALLTQVFGDNIPLGAKLDDGSVARGAALVARPGGMVSIPPTPSPAPESDATAAAAPAVPDVASPTAPVSKTRPASDFLAATDSVGLTEAQIAAARAREMELQVQDAKLVEMHAARNEMESFILEMRSAPRRKHGEKIAASALDAVLNDSENWLWDNPEASLEATQEANKALREKVGEICAEYFAAVEADKRAVEAALDEEAQRADAERAALGEDGDDHDNRKLRKPERMRMVVKNKEEGTELFKGGNYRPAAARYHKALTHAAKFFDLSPEDENEVKALKATLYLNLTSCYIKMENWDQALTNVNFALALDDKNPKAYFRRSSVFEAKKEWDKALEDIKKCQELNDVEDKVVTKSAERIKKEIQKEKDKEKKMWGKAFAAK